MGAASKSRQSALPSSSRLPTRALSNVSSLDFAGPKAVLAYLSRYTHRVAIANSRLISVDEHHVTFKWKDYRAKQHNRYKTMTLETPILAAFGSEFEVHSPFVTQAEYLVSWLR